ncbi:transposase [Aquibium sp. A9E412]|uniref:hypothetical protein n=1 Tax=Aquibium sp. A9E412 TaxID=2976767 RepID=UPI0025AFE82F|nr:hypothetical protein [Aquibium sp. A9E412]MDN2565203.1 transposase [Aquibium sp. A9E412]
MHLTLKKETDRPPGACDPQQQDRFDRFAREFNPERPHESHAMRTAVELRTPSQRHYHGLPEVHQPFHDREVAVTACGRICMYRKKINVSTVLAGQSLGIEIDPAPSGYPFIRRVCSGSGPFGTGWQTRLA